MQHRLNPGHDKSLSNSPHWHLLLNPIGAKQVPLLEMQLDSSSSLSLSGRGRNPQAIAMFTVDIERYCIKPEMNIRIRPYVPVKAANITVNTNAFIFCFCHFTCADILDTARLLYMHTSIIHMTRNVIKSP